MKRIFALSAMLLFVFVGDCGNASEPKPTEATNAQKATRPAKNQQEAIRAIESLWGSVSEDGSEIRLYGRRVTDADLENLKWFPWVKSLALWESHITDAGMQA